MKRKLIGLGSGSLVISLPSKFVQKNSLKKGDEISIDEIDNVIQISAQEKNQQTKKALIDVASLSERAILWALSATYKEGYDEIKVLIGSTAQHNYIETLTKDVFMGFMIVENDLKSITIRQISVEKEEEFKIVLRRAFLVALSLAENSLALIREGKFSELSSMLSLEVSNNQMTNFCQRIINKGLITKKPTFNYIAAWNLEKVADEYRDICKVVMKLPKIQLSEKNLSLFSRINSFFRAFYELYFDFSFIKLESLSKTKKELIEDADAQLIECKGNSVLVLSYLKSIIISCSDFGTTFAAISMETN